jgi:hypothetical protein
MKKMSQTSIVWMRRTQSKLRRIAVRAVIGALVQEVAVADDGVAAVVVGTMAEAVMGDAVAMVVTVGKGGIDSVIVEL